MSSGRKIRRVAGGVITAALMLSATSAAALELKAGACNPQYYAAMKQVAVAGAQRSVTIIRSPNTGIRKPESIFDFSCFDNLFDTPNLNILVDPQRILDGILGVIQAEICERGNAVYEKYVSRPLDDLIYSRKLPRIPGLEVDLNKRDGGTSGISVKPLGRPKANPRDRDIRNIFKSVIGG